MCAVGAGPALDVHYEVAAIELYEKMLTTNKLDQTVDAYN